MEEGRKERRSSLWLGEEWKGKGEEGRERILQETKWKRKVGKL